MTHPRLTLSINISYDADPAHYSTDNPGEMSLIDQTNYRENVQNILDLLEENVTSIKVFPEGTENVLKTGLTPDMFRGMALPKRIADMLAAAYLSHTDDAVGSEIIKACGVTSKNQGIFCKYVIERVDGKSDPNAEYFVLDLKNDKFAKTAILEYAKACAKEYPLLATDIEMKYGK